MNEIVSRAAHELHHGRPAAAIAIDRVAKLRDGLFDAQLKALDELADVFAVRCPRRAGKTHFFAAKLLTVASSKPNSLCLYLTLTRINAKRIIWRILKMMAHAAGISYVPHETELTLTLSNGSIIILGGADAIDEIEKWRGPAYDLVIVDECGSFPIELLRQLRDDVVEPATADRNGQQIYGGTPGDVPDGPWHELSPNDGGPVPVHHWSARDNTAVPGLWDRFLLIKKMRGWNDDHPTWIREYLGLWVLDPSKLIYPFNPEINYFEELPERTPSGRILMASGWRYVLGCDVGYVHACAFILVACHEYDPHDYVISATKHGELLPDTFAAIIASYLDVYPGLQVVVDTGGMGKIHAQWATLREHLPVSAAEKRDKPSAIRDARGRMLAGRVKLRRGEATAPLRTEMNALGWDKHHLHHNPEQEDHACDGFLYALRKLRNFAVEDLPGPSVPLDILEEERFIRYLENRAAGHEQRPRWDH